MLRTLKLNLQKVADGWDDFDIDENEPTYADDLKPINKAKENSKTSQDTGWDDFGDWGQDDGPSNTQSQKVFIQ